jgi:arylsulfatase A
MQRRDFIASLLAAAPAKPNIVLILMDDMGYPALSSQGNRYVSTPNLDRLASEGMRFTNAYVTPQCTPTRSTLMTGQYTARNRMFHVIPPYQYPYARVSEVPHRDNLSRDTFTLPKGLKAAGYRTAAIGKWHLTTGQDGNYNGLNPQASHHYGFDVVAKPSVIPGEFGKGDKAVNRFTDESIDFIRQNQKQPFFLYLAHHSIHNIVAAPEELVKKYRDKGFPEANLNNATYLAALEHMDTAIGRLLKTLDEANLRDNTIVIFLTDNGGIHRQLRPSPDSTERLKLFERLFDNAPLREGKGFAYEGGIRVPMLVRWPGTIKPNSTCHTPVHVVDILPTLLERTSIPKDHKLDGISLMPLFKGKKIAPRPLYWYMPFYDLNWAATPSAIMRDGDYKLIEYFGDYFDAEDGDRYVTSARLELFNLTTDPSEKINLATREPQRTAKMQRQLRAWIKSCGASIPVTNPNFDPKRAFEKISGMPRA